MPTHRWTLNLWEQMIFCTLSHTYSEGFTEVDHGILLLGPTAMRTKEL